MALETSLLLAGAQATGHVGQGDVGDGGVEHLHERGQRDGDGDEPRVVVRLPVQFVEDQVSHDPSSLDCVFGENAPSRDSKGGQGVRPNCARVG